MEIVSRVMDLYARMDKSVVEFQLKCGLRCPAGCGSCCQSEDVHVTVLEMLPIAHEILCNGAGADWLERLAGQPQSSACILFSEQPAEESAGHCRFYSRRPVLCRLFGFAAVRTRTGIKALSVCRHIKETDPQGAAAAMVQAEEAPCFVHYSAQLYALDPVLGTRLMPINTALQHAVERLGLNLSFVYRESLRDNTAA